MRHALLGGTGPPVRFDLVPDVRRWCAYSIGIHLEGPFFRILSGSPYSTPIAGGSLYARCVVWKLQMARISPDAHVAPELPGARI